MNLKKSSITVVRTGIMINKPIDPERRSESIVELATLVPNSSNIRLWRSFTPYIQSPNYLASSELSTKKSNFLSFANYLLFFIRQTCTRSMLSSFSILENILRNSPKEKNVQDKHLKIGEIIPRGNWCRSLCPFCRSSGFLEVVRKLLAITIEYLSSDDSEVFRNDVRGCS